MFQPRPQGLGELRSAPKPGFPPPGGGRGTALCLPPAGVNVKLNKVVTAPPPSKQITASPKHPPTGGSAPVLPTTNGRNRASPPKLTPSQPTPPFSKPTGPPPGRKVPTVAPNSARRAPPPRPASSASDKENKPASQTPEKFRPRINSTPPRQQSGSGLKVSPKAPNVSKISPVRSNSVSSTPRISPIRTSSLSSSLKHSPIRTSFTAPTSASLSNINKISSPNRSNSVGGVRPPPSHHRTLSSSSAGSNHSAQMNGKSKVVPPPTDTARVPMVQLRKVSENGISPRKSITSSSPLPPSNSQSTRPPPPRHAPPPVSAAISPTTSNPRLSATKPLGPPPTRAVPSRPVPTVNSTPSTPVEEPESVVPLETNSEQLMEQVVEEQEQEQEEAPIVVSTTTTPRPPPQQLSFVPSRVPPVPPQSSKSSSPPVPAPVSSRISSWPPTTTSPMPPIPPTSMPTPTPTPAPLSVSTPSPPSTTSSSSSSSGGSFFSSIFGRRSSLPENDGKDTAFQVTAPQTNGILVSPRAKTDERLGYLDFIKKKDQIRISDYPHLRTVASYFKGGFRFRMQGKKGDKIALTYEKNPVPRSLLKWSKITDDEKVKSKLRKDSKDTFTNVLLYMTEDVDPKRSCLGHEVIARGFVSVTPILRDEILCQIIKQITGNPSELSTLYGWRLLCSCLMAFPPTSSFEPYLLAYLACHAHVQYKAAHELRFDSVTSAASLCYYAFLDTSKAMKGKVPSLSEFTQMTNEVEHAISMVTADQHTSELTLTEDSQNQTPEETSPPEETLAPPIAPTFSIQTPLPPSPTPPPISHSRLPPPTSSTLPIPPSSNPPPAVTPTPPTRSKAPPPFAPSSSVPIPPPMASTSSTPIPPPMSSIPTPPPMSTSSIIPTPPPMSSSSSPIPVPPPMSTSSTRSSPLPPKPPTPPTLPTPALPRESARGPPPPTSSFRPPMVPSPPTKRPDDVPVMADDAPPAPELAFDAPAPPPMESTSAPPISSTKKETVEAPKPSASTAFSGGGFLDGLKNAKLKAVTKPDVKPASSNESTSITSQSTLTATGPTGSGTGAPESTVAVLKGIELPAHLLIKNIRSSVAGGDDGEESEDTDEEWG